MSEELAGAAKAALDLVIDEKRAGLVAAPDDARAIGEALRSLHDRWRAGSLDGTQLAPALRRKLDRRSRVRQLADLLHDLG